MTLREAAVLGESSMTREREVMRMALSALERGRPQIVGVLVQEDQDDAIAALRAAVAGDDIDWKARYTEAVRLHNLTLDELRLARALNIRLSGTTKNERRHSCPICAGGMVEEWNPLTEEEVDVIGRSAVSAQDAVRMAQAALQEKNA